MQQKTFDVGDVAEDLYTGNLVVIDQITDVDGDRYADISHVHDIREQPEHIGTRAIPEDLQAL